MRTTIEWENDSTTAMSAATSESSWVIRLWGSSATPESMMRLLNVRRSAIRANLVT